MKPQVEAWPHGVRVLGKTAKRHPQLAHAGLGVLLQLEWHYLQRTVPRVGTLMGPIKEALRETFFPALFKGEDIGADFFKILDHRVKHDGVGILDPWLSEDIVYNTSKAVIGELVGSLLGGTALNYVEHRSCVHGASSGARK